MALRMRAKRSLKPNIKVGALLLALGLALQPLTGLPMAWAADPLAVTPSSHPSIAGSSTAVSSADTGAHANLAFSFNYDVSAHFDNVRVQTVTETSVYDFDPDTTKPTGSFVEPPTGSVHRNSVNIAAQASDAGVGLGNLQIVLRDESNAVVGNWSYNAKTGSSRTITGTGTISYSGNESVGTMRVDDVDTSAFATGRYNLRFFTDDQASPKNSNSAIYGHFYVDRSAPDGEFVYVPTEPQRGETQISVDLEDVGMAGLGSQQIVMRDSNGAVAGNWEYNVKTGATRNIAGPAATYSYDGDQMSGRLTLTFDSSTLNGVYNLRLFAKDRLSNGRSNIYASIRYDNTAPSVAFTSPENNAEVQSTNVTGTLSDNENIAQYSFNVSGPVSWSTRKWTPNTKDVNFDVNLCEEDRLRACDETTLPDGTYTVRIAAYDGYGNRDISTKVTFQLSREAEVVDPGDGDGNTGGEQPGEGDGSAGEGDGTTPPPTGTTDEDDDTNTRGGNPTIQPLAVIPQLTTPTTGTNNFATTFIGQANDGQQAVAGASTNEDDDEGDILGTSTTDPARNTAAVQASSDGWNIFGLAWYWYMAILAGLIGAWLLLAAAIRRMRGSEAA